MTRRPYPLVTVLAILLLTGCTSRAIPSGPDSPSTPATTGGETVTVERTGGFAGVRDTMVIGPGGHWTRADRNGTQASGQLTADQRRELSRLLADPRLPDEARRESSDSRCRDVFNYRLSIGTMKISFVDCGDDGDLPAASKAVVAFVESVTGA